MLNIVKGELYKQIKTKSIFVLLMAALLPLAFSFLIYLKPSFLEVEGMKIGICSFFNVTWQSAWTLFIPHILLVYLISSVNEDEKQGQLIYTATRVKNRSAIIFGKFTTILLIFSIYILTFFSSSALGFIFFIRKTNFYNPDDYFTPTEGIQLLTSFLLVILIAASVYALSSFLKPIVTLIFIVIVHTAINSYLSESLYWKAIPGTLGYNMNYTVTSQLLPTIIYQLVTLLLLAILFLWIKKKHLEKTEISF